MYNKKKRLLGASTIDWTNPGPTLGGLRVGDEITTPSAYGFDNIVLEVVDKGHVDVSGKLYNITFQTKHLLSKTNGAPYYKSFDDSYDVLWHESSIRNWLNNETVPSSMYGSFLGSFLLDSSGSLKTGTELTQAQAFINALSKVNVHTHATEYHSYTSIDKVWIPAIKQVGGGVPTGSYGDDCYCLDKYRTFTPTTGVRSERVGTTTGGELHKYWLRSVYVIDPDDGVWYVEGSGSLGDIGTIPTDDKCCISPLMTIGYDDPVSTNTVTFDSKGGSDVSPQTVTTGSVITRPSNPTKSGSTFVDWYKEETYTTVYDFSTPVTSNFTLYAKWNDAPTPTTDHTVTVDYYQGTEHKVDSQTVTHGGNATIPTNYTRTGYTFVRWDGSFTNVTEDRTITAIYSSLTPGGIGGPRKPVYIDKNGDPKECGKQLHSITVQDLGAADGPLLAEITIGTTKYTIHDKKA